MKQLRMWFNQRIFNAGVRLSTFRKLDFPPKGWTSFLIRLSILSLVIMAIRLGA